MELSPAEQQIVKRIKRAQLFVFLRAHRHTLFDEAFQQELATMEKDAPQDQPPISPAKLGLATILQTSTRVSDDERIEALVMDHRWQLVLDCLDAETPPFSKPTFIAFRKRMIAPQMDRRLLDRTVQVAAATGAFGSRNLRAALDSSPLWGAGRVEDTYHLLDHAVRKALGVLARQQGRGLADLASDAGTPLVAGASLKAALDLDWDDPAAHDQAWALVRDRLDQFETGLEGQPAVLAEQPAVLTSLSAADQVRTQDVVTSDTGKPTVRDGVAPDRRISLEDSQMRHGRKRRSQLVDGSKRHVLRDLDSGLVPAVGMTPANVPEAQVTDSISRDLHAQALTLRELHIDRADLSSHLVRARDETLEMACRA